MKHIFLELEVRDGEREYGCPGVHEIPDGTDPMEFAKEWAADFYGHDPDEPIEADEDEAYWHCGGEVAVTIKKVEVIPEEHYTILRQYL